MVVSVLRGHTLSEGLSEPFLALIPKVKNPQLTSQFRPIGLCNVAYKVITKVIVQRLKRVLPNLISLTQVSFVPKRHIDDNVIIIQELLHTMRKKTGNTGWMAIKLDLEKAYDRLDRNFIQDTLQEMRLPQPLVEVIMGCITTCSIRVLWNGEPMEQFHPKHGICQGDSLSSYIFVACIARSGHLIAEEVQAGR